jgi:putative transposase
MGRFKSLLQAQRFLAAHDQINAISYRHARSDAFGLWADYAAELTA